MTPADTLAALRTAGVRVRLRGDGMVALDAARPPPPAVLTLARTHRDGIAALLRYQAHEPAPAISPAAIPPGVPIAWYEGVALLAMRPAPMSIAPARWTVLASTSARLLREHGATLHRAGWGTLDLFGLHRIAPTANPTGWGLAWLLGEAGEVLDVTPEAVGMRNRPNGARLTLRRQRVEHADVVAAWDL